MSEVHPIRPVEPSIDQSLIQSLEDMLAMARSGEIVAMACVTRDRAGAFSEFWSRLAVREYPVHFIAYLRVLQMRFERQIPLDPPEPRT